MENYLNSMAELFQFWFAIPATKLLIFVIAILLPLKLINELHDFSHEHAEELEFNTPEFDDTIRSYIILDGEKVER